MSTHGCMLLPSQPPQLANGVHAQRSLHVRTLLACISMPKKQHGGAGRQGAPFVSRGLGRLRQCTCMRALQQATSQAGRASHHRPVTHPLPPPPPLFPHPPPPMPPSPHPHHAPPFLPRAQFAPTLQSLLGVPRCYKTNGVDYSEVVMRPDTAKPPQGATPAGVCPLPTLRHVALHTLHSSAATRALTSSAKDSRLARTAGIAQTPTPLNNLHSLPPPASPPPPPNTLNAGLSPLQTTCSSPTTTTRAARTRRPTPPAPPSSEACARRTGRSQCTTPPTAPPRRPPPWSGCVLEEDGGGGGGGGGSAHGAVD